MNYVILHGTPTNIEKGEIADGAVYSIMMEGERETPWDYRKSLTEDAECVLVDGNYFSEEDNGVNDNSWTEEKRNLVHDKWLGLIDLIDKQIEENGRFDIELINYFSQEGDESYKHVLTKKIIQFLIDLNSDKADTTSIIEIMDTLDNY